MILFEALRHLSAEFLGLRPRPYACQAHAVSWAESPASSLQLKLTLPVSPPLFKNLLEKFELYMWLMSCFPLESSGACVSSWHSLSWVLGSCLRKEVHRGRSEARVLLTLTAGWLFPVQLLLSCGFPNPHHPQALLLVPALKSLKSVFLFCPSKFSLWCKWVLEEGWEQWRQEAFCSLVCCFWCFVFVLLEAGWQASAVILDQTLWKWWLEHAAEYSEVRFKRDGKGIDWLCLKGTWKGAVEHEPCMN